MRLPYFYVDKIIETNKGKTALMAVDKYTLFLPSKSINKYVINEIIKKTPAPGISEN